MTSIVSHSQNNPISSENLEFNLEKSKQRWGWIWTWLKGTSFPKNELEGEFESLVSLCESKSFQLSQTVEHLFLSCVHERIEQLDTKPREIYLKGIATVFNEKMAVGKLTGFLVFKNFPLSLNASDFSSMLNHSKNTCDRELFVEDLENWVGLNNENLTLLLTRFKNVFFVQANPLERMGDLTASYKNNSVKLNSVLLERVFPHYRTLFDKDEILVKEWEDFESIRWLTQYSLGLNTTATPSSLFTTKQLYNSFKKWNIQELVDLTREYIEERLKSSNTTFRDLKLTHKQDWSDFSKLLTIQINKFRFRSKRKLHSLAEIVSVVHLKATLKNSTNKNL